MSGDFYQQARDTITGHERQLRDTYETDLASELALVDDACALLLAVISSVGRRLGNIQLNKAGEPSGDVNTLQLFAQQVIGIRGLRVIRAARGTLSAGYEPEARAHDRILVELQANRAAIMADSSGKTALDWLRGKLGSGMTKRVKAIGPDTLYSNLSTDSHGGPTPVARLLDEATHSFALEPKRTSAGRMSLWLYAAFARDQATVIAASAGIKLENLAEFDHALKTMLNSIPGSEDQ